MDDPRTLRLVTVGLVLAALAVGYFLLTGFGGQPHYTEIPCDHYKNSSVANLPVRCLEYYGVK